MGWCFAYVNGRLAEIYFKEKPGQKSKKVWAHCYVKESAYKSKKEKKWIREDTTQYKFVYRNKKYFDKSERKISKK